jgi:hypothetical protein
MEITPFPLPWSVAYAQLTVEWSSRMIGKVSNMKWVNNATSKGTGRQKGKGWQRREVAGCSRNAQHEALSSSGCGGYRGYGRPCNEDVILD